MYYNLKQTVMLESFDYWDTIHKRKVLTKETHINECQNNWTCTLTHYWTDSFKQMLNMRTSKNIRVKSFVLNSVVGKDNIEDTLD